LTGGGRSAKGLSFQRWAGDSRRGAGRYFLFLASFPAALKPAGVSQAVPVRPQPGSISLLGSGLVGLAGYATIRWRTRQ